MVVVAVVVIVVVAVIVESRIWSKSRSFCRRRSNSSNRSIRGMRRRAIVRNFCYATLQAGPSAVLTAPGAV